MELIFKSDGSYQRQFEKQQIIKREISPLTEISKESLTNLPPTAGFYRVVVAPLTIQPQAAQGKPSKSGCFSVTPEAVRNVLFNQPDAVNKFYLEASYGKFGFTGVNQPQAVVPVTIQVAISNNCQDQIVSQFTPIVRKSLREQNIDTTNGGVDLGIIIFNDSRAVRRFRLRRAARRERAAFRSGCGCRKAGL